MLPRRFTNEDVSFLPPRHALARGPPHEAPRACGNEVGLNRTLARQELHCELLVWRWEALGEGDEEEFEEAIGREFIDPPTATRVRQEAETILDAARDGTGPPAVAGV